MMKKVIVAAALVFVLTILSTGSAQGCPLCNTQASGSGAKMIHALKDGILVLMFPPMGICLTIILVAYRKRNKFLRPQNVHKRHGPYADLGW